jgi:hypothetical protein
MFGKKLSQSDRRLTIDEILRGLTYYTEAQVHENKSGKPNPFLEALPKPMEKDKLAEALKLFEATPKE